jgi:hypothetical protein
VDYYADFRSAYPQHPVLSGVATCLLVIQLQRRSLECNNCLGSPVITAHLHNAICQ